MTEKIERIDIAAKLRKAILNSPESMRCIATKSKVDVAAISKFCSGKSLQVESIEKLAYYLGYKFTKDTKQRGGK